MTFRLGLLPILIPFVALPLAGCDKQSFDESYDQTLAALKGDTPATPVTPLINLSPPVSQSVEPKVEIAAVTEVSSSSSAYIATAHVTCDPDYVWRGTLQPGACSTSWY